VQHLLILVTVEKKITLVSHSARYLTPDFHFITEIAMADDIFSAEVHMYKI
jgi:hypothetical protein